MDQVTFEGMEPKYYEVPIDTKILESEEFQTNNEGMYERVKMCDPLFVQPAARCPFCGKPIKMFHEKILKNGMMQVTAVCQNRCGYHVPLTEEAREFAKKIRRDNNVL